MMRTRILLLQARHDDDPVKVEERRSFASKAGIPEERFTPHNLLGGPPSLHQVRSHDALMIGGSGDFYVSNGDLPQFPAVLDFLGELVAIGHPTFASCFGFQLLVKALGGEIVHDPDRMEVGTYELALTREGVKDPLLGSLPTRFLAQVGRKDRARLLPLSAVHLASSAQCPFHALRIPKQPIWATQFHPELNGRENRTRFLRYLKGYSSHLSPEEREEALQRFCESPETVSLISSFLKLVFG
ncbi:MAG: type 1 glutamine amidotransferase [Acidobacteriota bacterium]